MAFPTMSVFEMVFLDNAYEKKLQKIAGTAALDEGAMVNRPTVG